MFICKLFIPEMFSMQLLFIFLMYKCWGVGWGEGKSNRDSRAYLTFQFFQTAIALEISVTCKNKSDELELSITDHINI